MIVTLLIISGCLIMGCCILIGFLLGKFIGQATIEQKVLNEIEKYPSIQMLRMAEKVFGASKTIKIKQDAH